MGVADSQQEKESSKDRLGLSVCLSVCLLSPLLQLSAAAASDAAIRPALP